MKGKAERERERERASYGSGSGAPGGGEHGHLTGCSLPRFQGWNKVGTCEDNDLT